MSKLKLLDLFSGLGGFSLGLERTGGFETVAFCKIEPFPRKILSKHWPEVPQYEDIRELNAARLRDDGIAVDAICGGFPCQDISTAGKGAGIEGERSGLWSEYARLIGELRPRVVFVENVAALLGRGLERVLGDLAALGYDAEWHCISASAIGAHHHRDRLWIVAYATSERCREAGQHSQRPEEWPAGRSEILAHTDSVRRNGGAAEHGPHGRKVIARNSNVSDAMRERPPGQGRTINASHPTQEIYRAINDRRWEAEPDVGRVANGIPNGVDRLKALGNAVVPQIPELLGNAYLESIGWKQAA